MPSPRSSDASSLSWLPAQHIDNLWFGERCDAHGVPSRATAVALPSGGLAVFNPVKGFAARPFPGPPGQRSPTFLIAPNHFHNLGLAEQVERTPQVLLYASPTAIPRLEKRVKRPFTDVSSANDRLPSGFAFLLPPGTRAGEAWLSAPGPKGRAWVVGDAFFNIGRTPRSPMGLLLKLLGICPGLRIGNSFRWLVRDRRRYQDWVLERIAAEKPTTLVPCHGDVLFDESLPNRLAELVRRRL